MRLRAALALTTICLTLCSCFHYGPRSYLEEADALSRQKRYNEAIDAYRQHMRERLKVGNRPEWENPYFYLLLIGDIQLGEGKISQAYASYSAAEAHGVDPFLVSDRYRSVASWYQQRGQLQRAIEVLQTHRQMDTLLFDSMLDRLARELVKQEDERIQNKNH